MAEFWWDRANSLQVLVVKCFIPPRWVYPLPLPGLMFVFLLPPPLCTWTFKEPGSFPNALAQPSGHQSVRLVTHGTMPRGGVRGSRGQRWQRCPLQMLPVRAQCRGQQPGLGPCGTGLLAREDDFGCCACCVSLQLCAAAFALSPEAAVEGDGKRLSKDGRRAWQSGMAAGSGHARRSLELWAGDPQSPSWVLLPCQPQGRFLAGPVALGSSMSPALGAAGCPSPQPEDQGAWCSQMRRLFYISHLLPRHRCHLALSQPGYFLPNASLLHQAQRLQRMRSPGFCCHFQIARGPRLLSALRLGRCLWMLFARGKYCFLPHRCFLPKMLPQHLSPPPGNPWGMPSGFAGPPAFSFTPYRFMFVKPSHSGSFPMGQKGRWPLGPQKRARPLKKLTGLGGDGCHSTTTLCHRLSPSAQPGPARPRR